MESIQIYSLERFTERCVCLFCSPQGNGKMIINGLQLGIAMHLYEVRPRKDHRGFDLISDALPFGAAVV
jgi:hypothetical protein